MTRQRAGTPSTPSISHSALFYPERDQPPRYLCLCKTRNLPYSQNDDHHTDGRWRGFQSGGEPRGFSFESSPRKPVMRALRRCVSVGLKQKTLKRSQS